MKRRETTKHWPLLGALAATLLAARPAAAETPSEDHRRLVAEIVTDVPLGLGVGLDGELSSFRLGLTAHWVPPAYVAVADEVGQAVGGYSDLTSALVRAATENAIALRVRAGVRPVPESTFYIDATYTLIALGGAFTTADLAEASGQMSTGEGEGWDIGSTIHQVGFEIGYRFELSDELWLRTALGGSFTVAAEVDATLRNPTRLPTATAVVEQAGAAYLEETYTRYVHLPILSVAVGWDLLADS